MNGNDYKEAIRKYRGHLKSCENELHYIWRNGSNKLVEWSLVSKKIGIRKIASIAQLSNEDQDKFVIWVSEKVRSKNEIDTYLLGVI